MIFAKNKNLEEEVIALPCFVFFFFFFESFSQLCEIRNSIQNPMPSVWGKIKAKRIVKK